MTFPRVTDRISLLKIKSHSHRCYFPYDLHAYLRICDILLAGVLDIGSDRDNIFVLEQRLGLLWQ